MVSQFILIFFKNNLEVIIRMHIKGAYNEKTKKWYTVTKVGNGFDDARLEDLQTEIEMIEIKKNMKDVPDWLVVDKTLVPDFVVKGSKKL